MVDVVKDLKEHIQRQLAKGYSIADIERALTDVGFPRDSINEALKGMKQKGEKPAEKTSFFGWLKPKPAAAPKPAPKAEVKKPEAKPEPKLENKPIAKSWFSWGAAKPEKPAAKEKQIKKEEVKKPTEKKKLFWWLKQSTIPVKKTEARIDKPFVFVKKPKKEYTVSAEKEKKIIRGTVLTVLLILFFIIIGGIIWLFPATCVTEACFIEHANNCEAATFRNTIGGTTMAYQTNNCFIIKTVEKLNPTEPSLIKGRFEGKSMTCSYNKGDFDPLYVNTVSAHLNTCEGDLREEIIRVVT